jgi:regulator of sirC expression with transglutaminase-like and TPR domain
MEILHGKSDWNLAFAKAISADEDQINIAYAALLVASEAYPDLDIGSYLVRLDDMAQAVRPRLADYHPVSVLKAFLFDELGFHGNVDDFFDPRNSYLNQVLDRRTGIPITLSVIYLELARRLGLPIVGIGLPGHFIVRYDGDEEPIYLDPFNGGITMNAHDCRQRLADISNGRLHFRPSFLSPVGPRQILTRMLRNLKGIYVTQADFESALSIVEKLILLNPSAAEEIRDLGILHYYAGHKLKAVGCLERYLELKPDAQDMATVQHNLKAIIQKVARWN